jgi:uncharacterized protein
MSPIKDRLAQWLKDHTPHREELARSRWLRPIREHVMAPELWQARSEAMARGVAVGMFWAFAIPFAQIVFATAHCVWWRANIPIAAAITFITNPLTVGGWLWLAYHVGSLVVSAPPPHIPADRTSIAEWIQAIGLPAIVGMGLFAVIGAGLGYLAVKLVWRIRLGQRIRERALRRRSPSSESAE